MDVVTQPVLDISVAANNLSLTTASTTLVTNNGVTLTINSGAGAG